ncbi:hypothetical protein BJ508DRAFT_213096 [Ascobolus immersus RN42]|uniref:Aldos-2-ulose dehydratase/isomerase (AUDH) Cupin domain-containing protein n=1 Tax=Ascobolus immersus RN42 TaxID=1160509 RepID=A0A3N4HTF7_ASCIM|nr:hypothetical protein BJ508DRAFT_213096 [Ascobolus immersus RN42]
MIYLADPADVKVHSAFPLIEVANYAISVEVYPPKSEIPLGTNEGIKVLYGVLHDANKIRQPLGTKPYPYSATILAEDSSTFVAGDTKGAIILRFKPTGGKDTTWPTAAEVPVKSLFSTGKTGLSLDPALKFTKVEELWWGSGFKDVDFFNMSGFHFRFLKDKTPIAHMQFWTAGKNVNCGVHNHSDRIFQEIHISLSQGTKTGGMSRLHKHYKNTPEAELNHLLPKAFDHLVLEHLHEHGGMWNRDGNGKAVRGPNNVVSYPWHKWQAGDGDCVDVWVALEFNPDLESIIEID